MHAIWTILAAVNVIWTMLAASACNLNQAGHKCAQFEPGWPPVHAIWTRMAASACNLNQAGYQWMQFEQGWPPVHAIWTRLAASRMQTVPNLIDVVRDWRPLRRTCGYLAATQQKSNVWLAAGRTLPLLALAAVTFAWDSPFNQSVSPTYNLADGVP